MNMSPTYSVGMTAKQRQAYDFIRAGILSGSCPSYDEIAVHSETTNLAFIAWLTG